MRKRLLLLVLFAHVCMAQSTPSIINNASAPVMIVSSEASVSDMMSAVTLENRSSKDVTMITLGLIVSIPSACAPAPYFGPEHTLSRKVDLPAGGTATLRDIGLPPQGFRRLQQLHQATDVLPQVAVIEVKYADGKHWTLKRKDPAYDLSRVAVDASLRCSKSAP